MSERSFELEVAFREWWDSMWFGLWLKLLFWRVHFWRQVSPFFATTRPSSSSGVFFPFNLFHPLLNRHKRSHQPCPFVEKLGMIAQNRVRRQMCPHKVWGPAGYFMCLLVVIFGPLDPLKQVAEVCLDWNIVLPRDERVIEMLIIGRVHFEHQGPTWGVNFITCSKKTGGRLPARRKGNRYAATVPSMFIWYL